MSLVQTDLPQQKEPRELKVELSYGELKASFSGAPDDVLHSIFSFIAKDLPALNIARRLSLNFSAADLAQKFQDYVKITPEGARVMPQEKRISDKELVGLQLAGQIIANDSGNASSPSISLGKLQEYTGLIPKTLSSRLSELLKSGHVVKESTEEGPTFKITTTGIFWLSEVLRRKSGERS